MNRPDAEKPRPRLRALLENALSRQQVYVLFSAVLVLANARLFYGSLKMQTEHVDLWFQPERFAAIVGGITPARWSAPLDDVFIHFDFARATARGFPFQWIEGNGYSSGGTSLLYPFVLALGYMTGLNGLNLAHWAALVACIATFATLLGARRMFKNLPDSAALLAPPALLAVGALNWTLFSGMEVALFLSLWALSLVVWDDLMVAIEKGYARRSHALVVGLCCAFLVASRPEAAPLVVIFGVWSAIAWSRQKNLRAAVWTLILVGLPGALIVLGHMLANKMLTGTTSAAGALAKLEMYHPHFSGEEVFNSWVFFFKYQILRLSDYHFSAQTGVGYLVWPLAALAVVFRETRRFGILLWLSIVTWFALVSLNGQVRWQNERYSMPAVAWLLLSCALGMGATLNWAFEKGRSAWQRWSASVLLAAVTTTLVIAQAPRFRDQVWFFGRASRNILEQHVRTGLFLRESKPPLRRVLISDAGAIPFVSDVPAIDLIGLGGYGHLPIAGASRQGVGAAVELLEHVPLRDLPDVMALYPGWWGDFVLWFGRRVHEFPVRGNVICGGAAKVIYAPKWSSLLHSSEPILLPPGSRLADTLDVADILSEKAHDTSWSRPTQGYVGMKLLPDPRNRRLDLWDAGRLLSTGMSLDFTLSGYKKDKAQLLIRVAPPTAATLELKVDDGKSVPIRLSPSDSWQEVRTSILGLKKGSRLSLRVVDGEASIYHLFLVEETH
jgi:hypothetical protein